MTVVYRLEPTGRDQHERREVDAEGRPVTTPGWRSRREHDEGPAATHEG